MINDLSTGVEPATGMGRDVEIERTLTALREDAEIAHVLLGFSSALAEVRTVEATLRTAVERVPELMGSERCFVARLDRDNGRLYFVTASGFSGDELEMYTSLARTPGSFPLLRGAIEQRAPVMVEDVTQDERVSPREAELRGIGAFIGIPLSRRGEEFGGLGIEYRHPRSFGTKDEALARGIARQLGVALANARQFNLLNSLSSFGLRIATRLRLQDVSEEVARGAADLLGGDGARLFLVDRSRRTLHTAASFGLEPPGDLEQVSLDSEPWVSLAAGRTVLVSRSGDELQSSDDEVAIVATPIRGSDGAMLGAVMVFFDRYLALGPDETEALNVLASQSALALENAQRFERQRRVARSLQRGLLATEMPGLPGCCINTVYEPASSESDIGGDFFDVFDVQQGSYGLVVGDVSGKGAEAAALTAQAKYMLRAFASRDPTPASVLFHLNNALTATLGDDRFATLIYALYNADARRCVISIAGHPAPILFRAASGAVDAIELPGTILGAFADQRFDETAFELSPSDVFLAYTDGLTEARAPNGEMFGRARVEAALAEIVPTTASSDLARAVYDRASRFGRVTDDTVVFTLACTGD